MTDLLAGAVQRANATKAEHERAIGDWQRLNAAAEQQRRQAVAEAWQHELDAYDLAALDRDVQDTRSALADTEFMQALAAHLAAHVRRAMRSERANTAVAMGARTSARIGPTDMPVVDVNAFAAVVLGPLAAELAMAAVHEEERRAQERIDAAHAVVTPSAPTAYRVEALHRRGEDFTDAVGAASVEFTEGVAVLEAGHYALPWYQRQDGQGYTVTPLHGTPDAVPVAPVPTHPDGLGSA